MPHAMERWEIQSRAQDEGRAFLALVGVRHLPMLLLVIAIGNWGFTASGVTSPKALGVVVLPDLLYVSSAAVADAHATTESLWDSLNYESAYFIWPHFVAVSAGLLAARSMVLRRFSRAGTAGCVDKTS